ncbi:MAG: hypothetical protein L3K10_00020 [Thermoplasmata archaeon]|nr:hypothetical protein [Thermoplasmata archaeon]
MTGLTSSELTAVFIQVVIVLLIVRRSYAMTQGVAYSSARLIFLPILILVLWGVSELESILLTPWSLPYLIALDVAILIVTSLTFTDVAERMTRVTRGPSGAVSYQIGFSLAALFLGAFVLRLALALVLFPSALGFGSNPGGYPPVQQQIALGVIDALFSLSAGLLVARSIGIHRKVQALRTGAGLP